MTENKQKNRQTHPNEQTSSPLSLALGNTAFQFSLEGKPSATENSFESISCPKVSFWELYHQFFSPPLGPECTLKFSLRLKSEKQDSIFVLSNMCCFIPERVWIIGHIFKRNPLASYRHHVTNYSQWYLFGYQALGKFTAAQML